MYWMYFGSGQYGQMFGLYAADGEWLGSLRRNGAGTWEYWLKPDIMGGHHTRINLEWSSVEEAQKEVMEAYND